MLPLAQGGYLETSFRPTTTQGRWDRLLIGFRVLQNCVQEKGQPGWILSPNAGGALTPAGGALMLLSTESAMARQWSANAVGFGMNLTTLNLVETS